MKILVVGSGGREHAICWKLKESPRCVKLYCAPGSSGISRIAENVNINADDIPGLIKFVKDNSIDLTVVGPELPLVMGIADEFAKHGLKIFGPTKELANIEGSKVFAKELMRKFGIPTAPFEVFTDYEKAVSYIKAKGLPIVIKADGLCAGKGVVVCRAMEEAQDALKKMLVDRVFGKSGQKVIIEECLNGEEASIIVISDGKNIVPLASSQDHKRIFDHDRGPNTGGMGAYSPAPVVTEELLRKVVGGMIAPLVKGLASEGISYKGALYAGIMVTEKGPMVLEFNARFGDPETQAILPRLNSDFADLLENAVNGKLENYSLAWDPRPCVTVVISSGGYPSDFQKGMEIRGTEEAEKMPDVAIFHAGTKAGRRAGDGPGMFITNGGRVLNVTALGANMQAAISNCYNAVKLIRFDRMHYRKDIGQKALR
ncbi:MAG: phosphoribosylamine--glycine ligase [Candidatus Omnitrophica bacterium]|nr:phosphoribosylamine--glycine ligase [Candidatus Omnitrophota bacterium]